MTEKGRFESSSEPIEGAGGEAAEKESVAVHLDLEGESVQELQVEDELRQSYLTYAMSTIIDRAVPDVRDGLKPSQRRILVSMNDLNLGPRSKHRKCAKIAGDTSGNYHPHGQEVVYPTLVRMGQEWTTRYPLIDPQGNFGSIDGDPPAAMRYTEARMHAVAIEMLADLNLDTVDMQPNYDDTRSEPTVLPAKFPNLLVNGAQGIAVGMATSIPPHNLGEICDALLHVLDNPSADIADLMKIVKGPDFPTGGQICGRQGIVQGYRTGRGKVTVRAKMHVEEVRGGRKQIVVTEIPYQVLKSTIIERVAQVVKDGKIPDITNIQDYSDRDGMRIVIDLRKGVEAEVAINQLYKFTPLQSTFSIINIALVNRSPRTLTLKDMLISFVDHRREVITRRTTFLLRRARQRAHLLEGLILAVADINQIIQIIKSSPDVPTARERLMIHPLRLTEAAVVRELLPQQFVDKTSKDDQFLTGVQADAILIMQLQRLTALEIKKLARQYSDLAEEIEGYEALLGEEALLLDVIREDIHEMRDKYVDKRRTEIIGDVGDFDIEDLIAEEDAVVTLTHAGYVKRMPLASYRRQGRGGKGIIGSDSKDGDFVEHLFVASTHDYLLIFLNNGRMHWMKVYDIPLMARQARGRAIVNLLQMKRGERIRTVMAVRKFDDRFLVTATRNGRIKKTPLKAYSNPRRGGIRATGLDQGDMVIGVALTSGSDEIVLATADGKAIRFNESNVRPMGRTAAGVRGIHLREGDVVVDMAIVDPEAMLLTVCANGYGKRTSFDEYRTQSRGGYGIINIRTTKRNGKVVAMKSIGEADELIMITSGGMIVRTGMEELRPIGRATQGVRVIGLKSGQKLVSVARVASNSGDKSQSQA
ncbi:MAG: DNA gyrase subunit A [Planctomycetes bacterium]|nr:DNA gyrase subunit A [Planctomycetota bacterium]